MCLAGKASALVLAILALSATADAWAAGEQVPVSGCTRDIDGNPIRNSEVWLTDINNKVDLGDGSVAYTDGDGKFSLMMKKGSPDREEVARITIWSTIAGTRSKERGGFRDNIIARNRGSNPAPFSSPCLTIPASYFVGGRIEGKDPTPRPDGAIRLKVEVKGGGTLDHVEYVERLGNHVFETNPWWAKEVPYVVTIDRQPVDEFCWFPHGDGRGKTGDRPLSRAPRFVNEVLVMCKPAPRPPWFVVVGVVTGKDSTMRRGATLSLKLEPGGGAADSIEMLGNGRVEFKPILQPDTPFKVSVAGQPVNESCEVMPGAPNRTGASPKPGSGKNIIEVPVSCQSTDAAAAPPDLSGLPNRPGTELGNSLAKQGIADAERREREREAEERFLRLAATPSPELNAECARRAAGLAAVQRKALYEIRCALASQARTQVVEADRQIAAQTLADAAAERERQRLAALEAERSARDARELAAAVGQLAGVLAQAGRQSSPPVRTQPVPAPRVAQAAPSQGYAAVVPNPYYPTLACVQMGTQRLSNGQIIPCVQNNCGRSIESHTSVGMWTVGAGVCYSGPSRTIVLYGACERNDSFDRSRNMCKR